MTEKTEKQQYIEGPWNRVSGEVPLSSFELEIWKDNLDKMYGDKNWAAVPVEDKPENFYITASPDTSSVYAGMARKYDQEGVLDQPVVQERLGQIAIQELGPVKPPNVHVNPTAP